MFQPASHQFQLPSVFSLSSDSKELMKTVQNDCQDDPELLGKGQRTLQGGDLGQYNTGVCPSKRKKENHDRKLGEASLGISKEPKTSATSCL